jgi:hypothetical protein
LIHRLAASHGQSFHRHIRRIPHQPQPGLLRTRTIPPAPTHPDLHEPQQPSRYSRRLTITGQSPRYSRHAPTPWHLLHRPPITPGQSLQRRQAQGRNPPTSTTSPLNPIHCPPSPLHTADRLAPLPKTPRQVRHTPLGRAPLHPSPTPHNPARKIVRKKWAWHCVFRQPSDDFSRRAISSARTSLSASRPPLNWIVQSIFRWAFAGASARTPQHFRPAFPSQTQRRKAQGRAIFCVEIPLFSRPPPCKPDLSLRPRQRGAGPQTRRWLAGFFISAWVRHGLARRGALMPQQLGTAPPLPMRSHRSSR